MELFGSKMKFIQFEIIIEKIALLLKAVFEKTDTGQKYFQSSVENSETTFTEYYIGYFFFRLEPDANITQTGPFGNFYI